jgi:hypothetical protein
MQARGSKLLGLLKLACLCANQGSFIEFIHHDIKIAEVVMVE